MFETIEQKGIGRLVLLTMTTMLVTVLTLSGLVYSLYSKSLFLDTAGLEEQVRVMTPELLEEKPPEPIKETPKQTQSNSSPVKETTRQQNIQNIMETPVKVPDRINITDTNIPKSRPTTGSYRLGDVDRDSAPSGLPNRGNGEQGSGVGNPNGSPSGNPTVEETPPPIKTPTPTPRPTVIPTPVETPKPKPTTVVSKGVRNGDAISLPKPQIPTLAKALNAKGLVVVAVTIDENGNVTSAKAISGHASLRQVSEGAARQAKFRPTLLSGIAVKTTGTINYNFIY